MKYIIDENEDIEYVLEESIEDPSITTLRYSRSKRWAPTAAGEKSVVLVDDGDNISLKIKGKKPIALDYHVAEQVYLILKDNIESSPNYIEPKIIRHDEDKI